MWSLADCAKDRTKERVWSGGGMIPADLLNALREKDPELWERMRRMPVYVHGDEQLTIDLTKSNNTELVNALAAIP